jgi:peptidoglycan/LPS O-acetylase OafA/YrhL
MNSVARRNMPGLTGLRGVAVCLVIAYHLGHLRGGFIGVDVFFVLSGFLITTLLLDDTPRTPAKLCRWWGRRIRRLTPAVAVTVFVVAIAFATTSGIALDGLATLTWWQNWRLVLEGSSYWAGSPSPLRHAWSLSIEEQFYLLWPPLLITAAFAARRSRLRSATPVVAGMATLGAVASFVWAAQLAGGVGTDLSRVYFGTDTRAGALLIGCAVGAIVHRRPPLPTGRVLTAGALVATGVIGTLAVVMSPDQAWAYRGGLLAAAVAAVTVVTASSRPGPVSTVLAFAPLQWIGVRSYALYLWSWPTQIFLETRVADVPRWSVTLLTVAVSLVLSSLSLRFVEEPLRHGNSWATALRPRRISWVTGTAALVVVLLVAAGSTRLTVDEQLAIEFERLPDPVTTTTPDEVRELAPEPEPQVVTTTTCVPGVHPPGPAWGDDTSEYDPATVEAGADPLGTNCEGVTRLLVVGDSTGRGVANGLRRLAPQGLEVWDRTELGCAIVSKETGCPYWREIWPRAIQEVDPDVVLLYMGVSGDLIDGPDPSFHSDRAGQLRHAVANEAIDVLSAKGAHVVWSLPPVPLPPNGLFYCEGTTVESNCDPTWVDRWTADIRSVTAQRGAGTVDVRAWIESRPATLHQDRPDGLHLSGPALDAHAGWLDPQLRRPR